MHRLNKLKMGFILLTISIIILSSCGKSEKSLGKQGDLEVSFGGKVIEEAEKIIVEGQSNLIENARVNGYVIVDDDEVLSETTELTDEEGNFTMEMEHHQYGDAKVEISFDFKSTLQEEEVIEQYGEGGQDLEGDFVYLDEHYDMEQISKKAVVEVPLSTESEETEHEITAMEWNEQPEDYGDTRVWIEIDEVENDEDFFYINGSSNIMEGAVISGEYSGSSGSDQVQVNRDGTFKMEIPYKYDEDAHFEIKFRPSSGQWATIEDTYGENGEKLVGNLVEDLGSSLEAIAIIEYDE